MILTSPQDAHTTDRPITLPHITGVTIARARPETKPTMPTIRTVKPHVSLYGVALRAAAQRRLQWVREALQEAGE